MTQITYNTRMEEGLIKQFKILAIEQVKRQNAFEGIVKNFDKKLKILANILMFNLK